MPRITGTYRFAPSLSSDGNKVRRDGTTTDWWLIIQCCRELGRYQRELYKRDCPSAGYLSEPLWGAHVSIVQNEVPPIIEHWRDLEGEQLTLEYLQSPQESDGYVYLPVHCAEALDYRERLGLCRQPKWPLHLTIGNQKNI